MEASFCVVKFWARLFSTQLLLKHIYHQEASSYKQLLIHSNSDYFIDMTAFAALSYIVSMPRIARAVAVGYPHHIT